jgi:hypothetical protein
VSWWVFATAAPQTAAHLTLSADESGTDPLLETWMSPAGFEFRTASALFGGTPQANTWYHIELDIDWTTRMFTATVDGNVIGDGELGGISTSIQRLDLYNPQLDTVYFDQIELLP